MQKFRKGQITLLFIFILGLIGIGSVYASTLTQQLIQNSTLEHILKRGTLKVGMSTFVPWAMRDKTGQLIGFEIDVARELAKDMDVKVAFVPTKWSGIIPALLTGKFDVIIGGMGILPSRNIKVNFSIPYDFTGMSLLAHKTKAKGFARLSDFNAPNVVIAARTGTTAATAAAKYFPKATLRLFDDESQTIQEILSGRVHAVVASSPLPAFTALKYPDKLFLPLTENFTKEPIGFALKKGDVDTLNFFNNWIRIKHADGWLKERKDYWFKTKNWESQIK